MLPMHWMRCLGGNVGSLLVIFYVIETWLFAVIDTVAVKYRESEVNHGCLCKGRILGNLVLLKKMVTAMNDLCNDFNFFYCSEKGSQVQSMENSHLSHCCSESLFLDFKCERPTSLGIKVASLAKILKCAAKLILANFGGKLAPTLSAYHASRFLLTRH